MNWSLPMAKVAGIPFPIHTTFFLILFLGPTNGAAWRAA